MTPPLAAVEKRRDLLTAVASVATAATFTAVPADLEVWVAALRATHYHAWRHPDDTVTVVVTGAVAGRPIRVTTVFVTSPAWMGRTIADSLPSFAGPAPAGRYPFPETA